MNNNNHHQTINNKAVEHQHISAPVCLYISFFLICDTVHHGPDIFLCYSCNLTLRWRWHRTRKELMGYNYDTTLSTLNHKIETDDNNDEQQNRATSAQIFPRLEMESRLSPNLYGKIPRNHTQHVSNLQTHTWNIIKHIPNVARLRDDWLHESMKLSHFQHHIAVYCQMEIS